MGVLVETEVFKKIQYKARRAFLVFRVKKMLSLIKNILLLVLFKSRNIFLLKKPIKTILGDISFKLLPEGNKILSYWAHKTTVKKELYFLLNRIKAGTIFVDIGSGEGFFSIALASKDKRIKVLSFECNPEAFVTLQKNIKLNNIKNIITYRLALDNFASGGNFEEGMSFPRKELDSSDVLRLSNCCNSILTNKEEILIDDIGKLFREHNIKKIDIMKVDTGGLELFIFKKLKDLFKKIEVPLIIYRNNISAAKNFSYHPVEIMWLLGSYGYSFFKINKGTDKIISLESFKDYKGDIIAIKNNFPEQ